MTSFMDPLGHTITFTYTAHGDLETIIDPLGNTTTRTYDPGSRLLAQTAYSGPSRPPIPVDAGRPFR